MEETYRLKCRAGSLQSWTTHGRTNERVLQRVNGKSTELVSGRLLSYRLQWLSCRCQFFCFVFLVVVVVGRVRLRGGFRSWVLKLHAQNEDPCWLHIFLLSEQHIAYLALGDVLLNLAAEVGH